MPRSVEMLTPKQEATVRREIAAGATWIEAARAAGVTYERLHWRQKDQLADLRRGRGAREDRPRLRGESTDPSPLEIRYRAALIRKTWTLERWINGPTDTGLRSLNIDAPKWKAPRPRPAG